jgi:general secretion pathway protein G
MPNKQNTFSKTSGFTLIELLIVILVVGTLSGVLLGVVNSSGVRAKARDSQRKADIKKIQTALELYFADNRVYPTSDPGGSSGSWEQIGGGATNQIVAALQGTYIDPVPVDPSISGNNSGPCTPDNEYRYNYRSDGTYYQLTAIMEVSTSKDDSPCDASIGCGGLFDTIDVCYFAKNP